MPQLDAMLRALAQKGARELRLSDGARPVFCFPDGDRPVSQTVLNRAQITGLLAELADGDDAIRLSAGIAVRFLYRLDGGPAFLCESRPENGSYHASLTCQAEVPVGPAPVAAAAPAPAPAPAPVAVAPAVAAADAAPTAAIPEARGDAPAIERYLVQLVRSGSSDLHLSANEIPMLRLDGEMTRMEGASRMSAEQVWELIEAILPERNRQEFEETHDTDFAYEIAGLARFRMNAFLDRHGPGAVARVIPSKILSVEDLGLSKPILELCKLNKGLVLVTGPTGSGKSTTLAAMIDHVNRSRKDHIITIEDPIEFVHENRGCLVNQREVGGHTRSFKSALRAALREDPDIVLVGEMRDLETIAIAIETAETGHLVFGTLHTTTAASTVDRIIDQFPADRQGQIRTMLSESLRGVISQTLLRKKGGGRVAALEVLIVIPAIANLIREGKTFQIPSTMQTGKKYGMVMLNEALLDLVKRKVVEPDEAYAKAADKATFAGQLRQAGFQVPTSGA